MKNTPTEQIIDVTPEKVEIVTYVSPKQKLAMLAVASLLIMIAYYLSHVSITLYSQNEIINKVFYKKTVSTEITTKPLQPGDIIPVKGYLTSSVDNTLAELQNSIDKTSKALQKQQALHNVETELYKSHFGSKSSLSSQESRELLLKAGFKPNKKKIVPPVSSKEKSADGLELSHTIAKELIRDEVEGFLLKVKLATKIGEYLVED